MCLPVLTYLTWYFNSFVLKGGNPSSCWRSPLASKGESDQHRGEKFKSTIQSQWWRHSIKRSVSFPGCSAAPTTSRRPTSARSSTPTWRPRRRSPSTPSTTSPDSDADMRSDACRTASSTSTISYFLRHGSSVGKASFKCPSLVKLYVRLKHAAA